HRVRTSSPTRRYSDLQQGHRWTHDAIATPDDAGAEERHHAMADREIDRQQQAEGSQLDGEHGEGGIRAEHEGGECDQAERTQARSEEHTSELQSRETL